MIKFFYSMALALMALMLSLPAKATIFNIASEKEWSDLIVYHQSPEGILLKNGDEICLQKDLGLYYTVGADHGSVPPNWTLTVDLNGHTLRYDGPCDATRSLLNCKEGSTLNIKDSGNGGQWIFNDQDGAGQFWMIYMENNCTVNVYGGALLAFYNEGMAPQQHAIHCTKNGTVNIYDGLVSRIKGNDCDATQKNKINLYGGILGNDFLKSRDGAIRHDPFFGTIKACKIYGIMGDAALADYKPAGSPQSHINKALAEDTEVYIDGVLTPQDQLSSDRTTYENSYIEVKYKPNFTAGKTVTSDNANDIMGDGTMRFDMGTNTLYLTNTTGAVKNISSIYWTSFDLTIEVEGLWTCGSIESYGGDLTVRAHHRAMKKEEADMLSVTYTAEEPFAIRGGDIRFENRIRIYAESDIKTDAAFLCHNIYVDDSWVDAWGKPVAQCSDAFVTNATIKSGSFKNDNMLLIEPNITTYVVWAEPYDNEMGVVNGSGVYVEGEEVTLVAIPKNGYKFLRWSDGGEHQQRSFRIYEDVVLWAIFEPVTKIEYYTFDIQTADETMGNVSGITGSVEKGTVITVKATPKSGYLFDHWEDSHGQYYAGATLEWIVTADETLTAYFRAEPDPNDYDLWLNGTRVTASNANDVLGDGVWYFDIDTKTLTTMNHATYYLNDGTQFINTSYDLTIVFNHSIDVTTLYEESTFNWSAINCTRSLHLTGHTWMGLNLNAKNMRAIKVGGTLTVDNHISLQVYTWPTTDFGKSIKTAMELGPNSPAMIVNGATVDIISGVGQSDQSFKVSNREASYLQLTNGEIEGTGSLETKSLYITDASPQYEINYLTPALESLCVVGSFGNSYYEGTHLTLRAWPATGYKFVSWSDGNTDNPRYLVMPAENVYLDPIVEEDGSLTPKGAIITANATEGQGTIDGFTSGWFAEGTQLSIAAVPAEGYDFVQWSDGNTENPYVLTVEDGKNISITAIFRDKTQGIDQANSQEPTANSQKLFRDGILLIERNGKTYNAQGIEVK